MQPLTNLFYNLGWDLTGWTALLFVSEVLALLTIPSVLLQRRGQPLAALAWTLGLIAAPILGVLVWWLIGRAHLKRKRRRRSKAHFEIREGFANLRPEVEPEAAAGLDALLPLRRIPLGQEAGVFPAVAARRVDALQDGEATYATLEEIIAGARHHLHLLFYAWQADGVGAKFRDLLAAKARSGVQVRLLLDAMGSSRALGRYMDPLRQAGGRVVPFAPTRFLRRSLSINFRNHRKVLIADGLRAYAGGLNIGEEYTRHWRDLGLLVEGPVVAHLQEIFADDWCFATGKALVERDFVPPQDLSGKVEAVCRLIAGGPDAAYNATHDAFFLAATQARRRIWICTPYLAPDQAIQTALRTAVYRGVDVRVLVPAISDVRLAQIAGRSYYPALLESGIRVYEYLPSVLHTKLWLFDDELSVAGSANLDNRSFRLNFEVSCFVQSRPLNAALSGAFAADLALSREVTGADVRRTGRLQQLQEAAMNLLSPLL